MKNDIQENKEAIKTAVKKAIVKKEVKVDNIYLSLSKSQSEFGEILKSKKVTVKTKTGSYVYSYATLDDILKATKDVLLQNNIICYFTETVNLDNSDSMITCVLRHLITNETIESSSMLDKFLAGSSNMIQQKGSVDTYLRRYLLSKMLNIILEDDTDGNANNNNNEGFEIEDKTPITEGQITTLRKLVNDKDYPFSQQQFLGKNNVKTIEEMTKVIATEKIGSLIQYLTEKRKGIQRV
jgi:hypothetical protein